MTEKNKIEALRSIASQCRPAVVDGVLVDAFSANAIVDLHDRLSERNRVRFNALPVNKLLDVALRTMVRKGWAKA